MISDSGAGNAQDLASRCAEAMWSEDRATRRLGMQLLEIAPGRATLSMRVGEEMVNGHGTCHGGFIATLADSAFAFACNTHGDVTVAAGFDITFVTPARIGDLLVADAREQVRYGRSGIYDVTVERDGAGGTGQRVAEFRGRSRSLGRPLLNGSSPPDRSTT